MIQFIIRNYDTGSSGAHDVDGGGHVRDDSDRVMVTCDDGDGVD